MNNATIDLSNVGEAQRKSDEDRYQAGLDRAENAIKAQQQQALNDLQFNAMGKARDGDTWTYEGELKFDTYADLALENIVNNEELKSRLFIALFAAKGIKEVDSFLNDLAWSRIA